MTDEPVLTHLDERGVATLTLNRPGAGNAYNSEMIDALITACERASLDDAVRVVVLRGNGHHFQAGADLKWLRAVGLLDEAQNAEVSRRTALAMKALNALPKPTLALVHGGCFGGGVGLVASCDVAIATGDAAFAITEVRWGLIPAIIVAQLNDAIGVRNVRRYALSGERFDADTAKRIGLIHEVARSGQLDNAASALIDQFLLSAPHAVAQTKRIALAHADIRHDDEGYTEALVAQHAAKRRTAEAAEGLNSFREKRRPAWYPGGTC